MDLASSGLYSTNCWSICLGARSSRRLSFLLISAFLSPAGVSALDHLKSIAHLEDTAGKSGPLRFCESLLRFCESLLPRTVQICPLPSSLPLALHLPNKKLLMCVELLHTTLRMPTRRYFMDAEDVESALDRLPANWGLRNTNSTHKVNVGLLIFIVSTTGPSFWEAAPNKLFREIAPTPRTQIADTQSSRHTPATQVINHIPKRYALIPWHCFSA